MPVTEDDDIDEETLAELEALIENLDLDQLEQLQAAIGGGAEGPKTEFEMISEELRAMGLDQDDIEDLKMIAGMMHGVRDDQRGAARHGARPGRHQGPEDDGGLDARVPDPGARHRDQAGDGGAPRPPRPC